ncbi:ATP-binding protein [Maridesulfovibrio sp.]|uniref:AAA family ATPase n=1 Tax=Maridesulfovibrio sp. TaxID=2795000 RepID=UPI002A188ADF|nr:ATP-binding protein [Maridesulfovibrio sp.]
MKLLIENFYNIKQAELDFKRFNILIGPQAAGKSLIAKVLYFLNESILTNHLTHSTSTEQISQDTFNLFHSIFETKTLQKNFSINIFATNNYSYSFNQDGLSTPKNDPIKEIINKNYTSLEKEILDGIKKTVSGLKRIDINSKELEEDPLYQKLYQDFLTTLADSTNYLPTKKHLFIPASRALVNILQDNSFWVTNEGVDIILSRFGKRYFSNLKTLTAKNNFSCPELQDLIKGEVQHTTSGYSITNTEHQVSLHNASSGQQAIVPLLIALHESAIPYQDRYIEEPEAHIFPDAQHSLIKYIAKTHNQTKGQMTITTHSPYILTAVNNLIYAGTVGKQSAEKAAKVRNIIPENQWLNAEDVAAYMVEADGTVRSIMDKDTGLIDADSIDDVSGKIGTEFDQLLDIEYEEGAANG